MESQELLAQDILEKSLIKKLPLSPLNQNTFFSRTSLMYVYMGHLKFEHTQPYENWFWEKNNIHLKQGFVEAIHTDKKQLTFTNGEILSLDKLIIATGSKPNKFGWSGQDLDGVMGRYHKQKLEKLENGPEDGRINPTTVLLGNDIDLMVPVNKE